MNKIKTAVVLATLMVAGVVVAGPHHGRPGRGPGGPGFHRPPAPMRHGGFHRPAPPPMRHGGYHRPPPMRHCHGGSAWGRGGRHFWPGFIGGVIGGAITRTVVEPAPVVVTAPTVVTTTPVVTQTVVAQPVTTVQNVWVEGRYVDQVQANGIVVRTWRPGHYEQRQVIVQ